MKQRKRNYDISKLIDPNFDFSVEEYEIGTILISIVQLFLNLRELVHTLDSCHIITNLRL